MIAGTLQDEKGKVYVPPYFPIGAIYLSATSTNTSVYFSGTWTLIGQGVCFGGLYNTSTGGALQVAGNKVLGFVVESSWT